MKYKVYLLQIHDISKINTYKIHYPNGLEKTFSNLVNWLLGDLVIW